MYDQLFETEYEVAISNLKANRNNPIVAKLS